VKTSKNINSLMILFNKYFILKYYLEQWKNRVVYFKEAYLGENNSIKKPFVLSERRKR